ncbi:hypothetical protein AB0N23_34235 [Streptomyces sp. NPDC052644]
MKRTQTIPTTGTPTPTPARRLIAAGYVRRATTSFPTAPLPPAAQDALRRLEAALTTPDPTEVAQVRTTLGYPAGWRPRPHLGETTTRLTVWSQHELDALYQRVGGTVTTRQATRTTADGTTTWTATEITLTVQVPGVGPVEIVTDIEDDPANRTDLSVIAAARSL